MGLTTKVLLNRVHQKQDGSFPLVIRVTYNRKTIYIPLGYTLQEKDFDGKNQRVKPSTKSISNVTRINNQIASKVKYVFDAISKLEESGKIDGMAMKEIKRVITGEHKSSILSVFQFFEKVITELRNTGKYGNSIVYKDSYNAWMKFRTEKDLQFREVNALTLKSFENYFLEKSVKPNTISVYLRTFRALYNRAIKEGYTKKEYYPFDQYRIPSNKTKKKAVSLNVIALIENYSPELGTQLWHSRNFFLFSFYTRGMNFVDMAYLKIENIQGDRIFYTRRKTGGEFTIKVNQRTQKIIDSYAENKMKSDYLFPIIKNFDNEEQTYLQVKNRLQNFNKSLKKISNLLNLDIPLSTYTARHSYATGLKMKGLSSEVIKESLGHTNVAITEGYLKSFENTVVDEADDVLFA